MESIPVYMPVVNDKTLYFPGNSHCFTGLCDVECRCWSLTFEALYGDDHYAENRETGNVFQLS